jgi:anti-sigma B factor antagonist
MNAVIRDEGDSTVVTVEGKITIGAGDTQLRDLIRRLLGEGRTKIVLDLGGVTTIDTSGVGELVGSYTSIVNAGGKLVLTRLPGKLNALLHSTQFISIFDVAERPEDGLKLLQHYPH